MYCPAPFFPQCYFRKSKILSISTSIIFVKRGKTIHLFCFVWDDVTSLCNSKKNCVLSQKFTNNCDICHLREVNIDILVVIISGRIRPMGLPVHYMHAVTYQSLRIPTVWQDTQSSMAMWQRRIRGASNILAWKQTTCHPPCNLWHNAFCMQCFVLLSCPSANNESGQICKFT